MNLHGKHYVSGCSGMAHFPRWWNVRNLRTARCFFLFSLCSWNALGQTGPPSQTTGPDTTASRADSPQSTSTAGLYIQYPFRAGKDQPLGLAHLPSWMTLTFELRGRLEGQTSFNDTQGADRTYVLSRTYGGLEVRPDKHATVLLQFIDTHALGLPLHAVQSNMRDVFDLRQGWLNLHGSVRAVPVEFIVGRQELKFGSERIVGISDWTNNSRTWDGFDLRLGKETRIDLFSTSVVTVNPSSLDTHGSGLTFHGAYGKIPHLLPRATLAPYLLFHNVRGVTGAQGVRGNQLEATFGAEVDGLLPAKFSYEGNAALQRGSYSNEAIRAGQSFVKVYYLAQKLPWRPRVGGEFDYATGDAHTDPKRMGTYDQQYPSNHNAFGNVDLFGYQNIRQERINLDLGPAANLSFLLQGGFLDLAQVRDSVYSGAGTVAIPVPAQGFTSNQLGTEFDFSGKYVYHKYLVANFGVGHLFPGAALAQAGKGAAATLGYFSLTYRFRVDNEPVKP